MNYKNLVLTNFPFKIVHERENLPVVACPQCGKQEERRARTVCSNCNQYIPTVAPRRTWSKNRFYYNDFYREQGVVIEFPDHADLNFKKIKKNYSLHRGTRKLALNTLLSTLIVFGTAYECKLLMGESSYRKLDQAVNHTVDAEMHHAISAVLAKKSLS